MKRTRRSEMARARRVVAPLLTLVLCAGNAHALTPDRLFQPPHTLGPIAQALEATFKAALPADVLGLAHPCAAVGRFNRGRLLFAERMEPSPGVHVIKPDDSWGCPEVLANLRYLAAEVRRAHPGGADLQVGDISRRHGGRYPPHRTHQTGRDVDLRYYVKGVKPGDHERRFVGRHNLDVARMWTLLETLHRDGLAEVVYIDWRFQREIWKYARQELKKTRAELAPILSWPRARRHPDAMVQHVRNHHHHLHIRFYTPLARLVGKLWSMDEARAFARRFDLETIGHFDHVVRRGETLGHIAEAHSVDVDDLRRWNRMSGRRALIRPGDVLRVVAKN